MNSDQLIKFKTVVECGTLSKAAEMLFVSQPALSYTISMLEKETGNMLFLREKNKLTLTAAGEILLQYAIRVSDILSRANQAMLHLKIAIPSNNIAATMLLMYCPTDMLENIRLILAGEEEFPKLLLNGTLDLATCDDHYMREILHTFPYLEVEKQFLFEEQLGILAPQGHPLYDRPSLTYEELDGIPLSVQADAASLMLWLKNIEKIRSIPFQLDYPFDHITLENIRHRLSCAEIRRSCSIVDSPDRQKATQNGYRFIPLEGVYSKRSVYLWYLRENRHRIQPLLDSLDYFYKKLPHKNV